MVAQWSTSFLPSALQKADIRNQLKHYRTLRQTNPFHAFQLYVSKVMPCYSKARLRFSILVTLDAYTNHKLASYITHGAEPFLRSSQLCSYSRTSQHFMELEGSLKAESTPGS
jgi:hypothetical protein